MRASRTAAFLTKAQEDSGNFCTATRICAGLEKLGWQCSIVDVRRMQEEAEVLATADVLLCLHLLRCAPLLRLRPRLPAGQVAIGIVGGTDLNLDSQDAEKLQQMREFAQFCSRIVTFTDAQRLLLLQLLQVNTPVRVIPQGVALESEVSCLVPEAAAEPYFLVLGRVRAVKNCCSILQPFHEWSREVANSGGRRFHLLFAGDTEDSHYGQHFSEQLSRFASARRIGGVQRQLALRLLLGSVALINCSLSEGQSNSVLEAMHLRVPVIASDVIGNRDLVLHMQTGFLFSNDEEFAQCLGICSSDHRLLSRVTAAACDFAKWRHSAAAEASAYAEIAADLLRPCAPAAADSSHERVSECTFPTAAGASLPDG